MRERAKEGKRKQNESYLWNHIIFEAVKTENERTSKIVLKNECHSLLTLLFPSHLVMRVRERMREEEAEREKRA